MPELMPPLAHLLVRGEHAIHRALGAEVLSGVEERRVDFRRREIHEAWLVQHPEDRGLLRATERAGRGPARWRGTPGPPPAGVGRARPPEPRAALGRAETRARPPPPFPHHPPPPPP